MMKGMDCGGKAIGGFMIEFAGGKKGLELDEEVTRYHIEVGVSKS